MCDAIQLDRNRCQRLFSEQAKPPRINLTAKKTHFPTYNAPQHRVHTCRLTQAGTHTETRTSLEFAGSQLEIVHHGSCLTLERHHEAGVGGNSEDEGLEGSLLEYKVEREVW